jgi:sodium pump decarboxylase gamma subunit
MDWPFVFSTVVTGLFVVFAILIFLIGIISVAGKILTAKSIKKTVILPAKPARIKTTKPAPVAAPRVDKLQIIAVITAAIEAYSTQTGKKFKIVDIKPRDKTMRSAWGNAGVSESMR